MIFKHRSILMQEHTFEAGSYKINHWPFRGRECGKLG